jgi:hypothetical protein
MNRFGGGEEMGDGKDAAFDILTHEDAVKAGIEPPSNEETFETFVQTLERIRPEPRSINAVRAEMGLEPLPVDVPILPVDAKSKASNPKDALGISKVPITTLPMGVLLQVGLAMMEGGRKYGRHNFRGAKVPAVRASVYIDAAFRHEAGWWEGQDTDPDSGLNHIIKAIASLVVLADAIMTGQLEDDRPPRLPEGWMAELNKHAKEIIERYPVAKDPYTQKREDEEQNL